jgi:hypothetical protein
MSTTTFSGPVVSTNGFTGAITGNVTGNVTGDLTGAVLATTPVNATAASLSVTQATHAGRTVTLNRAAGIAVTLPAASGTGSVYQFVIGTTVTSNSTTIKVANSSDTMTGTAYVVSDNAAAVLGYRTGASDDTITLNGTTTGGLKGDLITIIDVGTNLFSVIVQSAATGSEATPFSATV